MTHATAPKPTTPPAQPAKKPLHNAIGKRTLSAFDRFMRHHQLLTDTVPTYRPAVIESLLSFDTFKRQPQLWLATLTRFFVIFAVALELMVMSWWEGQIWTYIGQGDIEWAQSQRRHRNGALLAQHLLELGPTFIKVGQSLSSRVDLMRKEYIDELAKLQDRVPAFSSEKARQIITEELDKPPELVFKTFEPNPIAAASLGQVHRCTLHDGTEAVIKVQRPHLAERFMMDLCVMKKLSRWLEKNLDIGRGREWTAIVDEFGRTLFDEIDYIQEGRNADRFRRNFAELPHLVIPQVHWDTTTHRVITLDYEPGIKINNTKYLMAQGFDMAELSTNLVHAYFRQLLQDGFFHADPHPGNLVVNHRGQLVFYDFGMVGHIPDEMRLNIVSAFLNIVNRRTDAILSNLYDLNMILPWADLDELRRVIDWALDTYYNVPHDQIDFEYLANELSEVIYYYPFKLPANFTFMFRAMMTLEGVATSMYPQIQFMGVAVQYAQEYLGKAYVLEQLLGESGIDGYRNLIRDGLDYLGIPVQRNTHQGTPRVQLRQDEWIPLSRYIKAGFLVTNLALSALTLFCLSFGLMWLFTQSPYHQTFGLHTQPGWIVITVATLIFVGLMLATYGTILMLPSRKKAVLFNPTNMMRNDPK